eukprot:844306-Pyramimonas_sp.AAC.1
MRVPGASAPSLSAASLKLVPSACELPRRPFKCSPKRPPQAGKHLQASSPGFLLGPCGDCLGNSRRVARARGSACGREPRARPAGTSRAQ